MATETIPAEDLEAAKERVKGILGEPAVNTVIPYSLPPTRKKTRSDAGTKRAPEQEPAKSGALTGEQAAHLDQLVHEMGTARAIADRAELAIIEAERTYREYLAELQGK